MVTLIVALTFMAFYLLYSTSKKMAAAGDLGLEKLCTAHKKASQWVSLVLMILSLGLSCHFWGLGSGTFTFFILLMTVASLIILLAPLRLLNHRFLGLLFSVALFFETLMF